MTVRDGRTHEMCAAEIRRVWIGPRMFPLAARTSPSRRLRRRGPLWRTVGVLRRVPSFCCALINPRASSCRSLRQRLPRGAHKRKHRRDAHAFRVQFCIEIRRLHGGGVESALAAADASLHPLRAGIVRCCHSAELRDRAGGRPAGSRHVAAGRAASCVCT